jgi:serine/threonine protein kinase
MGVVYLAVHGGQQAAVKTVHPRLLDESEFRERFRREARAVQLVDSPRVARLLEVDLEADPAYLAFARVEGPTLADHLREVGPFEGAQLVAFAVALVDALTAVHEAGVTHRDLKPSNVICSSAGPVVIDFGVALVAEATTSLTATGVAVGSVAWMSPEQLEGRDIGPASDVFAWAATVAFAASGQPPFGAGRAEAVAYRILHNEPCLPELPQPLGRLVEQALSKDPARRPTAQAIKHEVLDSDTLTSTPDDVAALLERTWRAPQGQPNPRLPRRPHSPPLLAGAAVCALAGLLVVGLLVAHLVNRPGGTADTNDPRGTTENPPQSPGTTATSSPGRPSTVPTTTTATAPGPPAPPQADWAGPAVQPPPDLQPTIDALYGTDRQTGPFGCPLYAPTTMADTGWAPSGFPQYTRIGTFQFGWESGTGPAAYLDVHQPDSQNVRPYFDADPEGLTYDDGSVRRTNGTADTFLITIPGSPCYYEISLIDVPMVYRSTVLALRKIELPVD